MADSHEHGCAAPVSSPECRIPECTTIADAVARASGTDPTELPPLYEVLDPDALETLLASGAGDGRADITVTFSFAGYDVSVRDSGSVFVTEQAAPLDE